MPSHLALPKLSRTVVRNLLLGFVVLDLLVLAAFSVRVSTTTTTRTTSVTATVPATTPAPEAPSSTTPLPVVDAGIPLEHNGVPLSDVDTTPVTEPDPEPEPTEPEPSGEPEAPLPDGSVKTARCPIHIADHHTDGGLQSLIGFAPLFGPFSAEAFAMASMYQPALQLIGPILEQYPKLAPKIEPLLDPLIGTWKQLLDKGFTLLGPLYAPHRTAVLEAETKLAKALTPYVQKLASSPLAGCAIELQNALLHDIDKP